MGTMLISCTSKRCQRMPPRRFTCAFPASHSSATTEEHWWSSVLAAAGEPAAQATTPLRPEACPEHSVGGRLSGRGTTVKKSEEDSKHAEEARPRQSPTYQMLTRTHRRARLRAS